MQRREIQIQFNNVPALSQFLLPSAYKASAKPTLAILLLYAYSTPELNRPFGSV